MVAQLRIERLLGARIAALTEADLRRVITRGVQEDVDLDFKQETYTTNETKRALATDVAAMANTLGGVIIIGIRDEEAVAVELTPVELSDAAEAAMYQTVHSQITPTPQFAIRRVSGEQEGFGYFVLDVPRSTAAPHAVRAGDHALRFPRRYGTTTAYMSESEVADSYRSRFAAARGQVERLRAIHDDGVQRLSLRDTVWATLSLVPSLPGAIRIRQAVLHDYQTWMLNRRRAIPSPASSVRHSYDVRAGIRRVVLTSHEDRETGLAEYGHAQFHVDGSAFVAVHAGWSPRNPNVEGDDELRVFDENLVGAVVATLDYAVDHAVTHAGAGGDAVVLASLATSPTAQAGLFHTRSGWGYGDRLHYTQSVSTETVSEHTIDLEAAAVSTTELLAAAHLIITDLVQAFGLPEPYQITPEGAVRLPYFGREQQEHVSRWAQANDVDILTSTVQSEP